MLHLLCSPDRVRNAQAVIDRICAEAGKGRTGQILIVPEQYSHETERALCAAGGDAISRYAEVLSFSRLASRVFSVYGGVCQEYLDKGGRLLTMYLAVQNVQKEIKYYAAVCAKPEFLQRLCDGVEEFLSYGLTPRQLLEASESFSGQFSQKLHELGLIYESYLAVCSTGRSDPVTRLMRLGELLQETDFLAGKTVWLDGFTDFTALELRILEALMRYADQVTVSLTTDRSRQNIFRTANDTGRTLRQLAERWQVPVQTEPLEGHSHRTPALQHWLDQVFRTSLAPRNEDQGAIYLHHASGAEAACGFATGKVQKLVREGARWREVCIAYTDQAAYEPHLRRIFARAGIPAYFSGNDNILQKPLFAALLWAMEAADRLDRTPVLEYLKSMLSPLTADAADRLQQYVHTWNIRGSSWLKEWTMHPAGYGEAWKDQHRLALVELNAWREAAMEPLHQLREDWKASKTVRDMTMALDAFLERVELRQLLQQQTQDLEQAQDLQKAQQTGQLYEILVQAMEQLVQVLGESQMTAEQFTQVFRLLLSQYQVGTIPAALDQVQVGPTEAFRHKRAKHMIILGAEEGKLPSFNIPLGVFTDQERQQLIRLQLPLSPAQEQKLDRELAWIAAAFSAPESSVSLCCAGDQPSYLYQRTQALFPGVPVTGDGDYPYAADESHAASRLLSGEAEGEVTSPVLLQALYELKRHRSYDFDSLSERAVQGLYGREIGLSASRIDQYAACKFSFFLQYGLKAQPWKEARFDAPIFGTFVHYVLEKTVDQVKALGGFSQVSPEQLSDMAKGHAQAYTDAYLPDLEQRGERYAYLFRRSIDEVLAVVQDVGAELRLSQFRPESTELSFGGQEPDLPPVRIQGEKGSSVLQGFVDRVDLFHGPQGTYYRVVDYKTGHKDFDYADLLCGRGLQMLIYLFALKQHGAARYGKDLLPAGVLYVPARQDMERVDAQDVEGQLLRQRQLHHRRKGLVLDSGFVLEAMERTDQGQPIYLPYQNRKDSRTGDLASEGMFQLLERFVNQSLADMTDGMYAGQLTPDPIFRGTSWSSCAWCDYRQVCHMDACRHDNRTIAAVTPGKFWEEVERRERDG